MKGGSIYAPKRSDVRYMPAILGDRLNVVCYLAQVLITRW